MGDDDDTPLLADGFEDAVIGTAVRNGETFVVYDLDRCVTILMKRDGITADDALEYLEFNTLGTLMTGANLPAFFTAMSLDDINARYDDAA